MLAQAAEALDQRLVGDAVGRDLQDDALRAEGQRVHRQQELGGDVEEGGRAAGGLAQAEVAQRAGGDARGRGVRALGAGLAAVEQLVAGQAAVGVQDRLAREEDLDVEAIGGAGGAVAARARCSAIACVVGRCARDLERSSTGSEGVRRPRGKETARRERRAVSGRRDTAMCRMWDRPEAGER